MSERPYIVHVTEVLGGVETYLRVIVDHWPDPADLGFVLAVDGSFAEELRARGHQVRIVALPRTRTRIGELRAVGSLQRALRDLRPDIVHLHSSQAGLVGRLAWARPGRRVFYTPHAFYYLGKSGAARATYRSAETILDRVFQTRVLATSPSEAARAIREVRIPERRVRAVTNAVEVPDLPGPRSVGLPPTVVLVGRVSAQKDIAMYLRVVARLLADPTRSVTCHLVGVGHYADDLAELRRLMECAGVPEDGLVVTPWMPRVDLLEWIGHTDVVVLTSAYESFGYTLAEATARGVPVIGTDVDGIRDVIEPGVTGFVVAPGDDAAMHQHLVALLDDAETYARMSAAGPPSIADRLGVGTFVRGLVEAYAGSPRD